jgi:hypothetical protein
LQEYTSGDPIAPSDIPGDLAKRIGPEAPERARMAVARALLPMPSDQLGIALGILARDDNGELATAAKESLGELDQATVKDLANRSLPHAVLDVFAVEFKEQQPILLALVNNTATHDDTVRWMARHLRGPILEHVARNQQRYLRYTPIIAALMSNPATPTPTLAPVIETAVRNEVDTLGIPGFKQLADAFFADVQEQQEEAKRRADERDAPKQDGSDEEEEEAGFDEPQESTNPEGVPESVVEMLLTDGTVPVESEGEGGEETEQVRGGALWATINQMSVAQKVRLALMGDASARAVLVRDPKKMVAMAVLKSPRLTDKEIAGFATNKTIGEEVIRSIAGSREYTKNYSVRLALVHNPKCPPSAALTFLRTLRARDVRDVARAKDVPAYLIRSAKEMLNKRS